MKSEQNFSEILDEIGVKPKEQCKIEVYQGGVSSDSAERVLKQCLKNLCNLEVTVPNVELELTDNPEVQCATNIE